MLNYFLDEGYYRFHIAKCICCKNHLTKQFSFDLSIYELICRYVLFLFVLYVMDISIYCLNLRNIFKKTITPLNRCFDVWLTERNTIFVLPDAQKISLFHHVHKHSCLFNCITFVISFFQTAQNATANKPFQQVKETFHKKTKPFSNGWRPEGKIGVFLFPFKCSSVISNPRWALKGDTLLTDAQNRFHFFGSHGFMNLAASDVQSHARVKLGI